MSIAIGSLFSIWINILKMFDKNFQEKKCSLTMWQWNYYYKIFEWVFEGKNEKNFDLTLRPNCPKTIFT